MEEGGRKWGIAMQGLIINLSPGSAWGLSLTLIQYMWLHTYVASYLLLSTGILTPNKMAY